MKAFIIFCFMVSAVLAISCYDETRDIVKETAIPSGKGYYPVSANTFVDLINAGTISNNRIYVGTPNIAFEVQYWTLDALQEIAFYKTIGAGPKELISITGYSPERFSAQKSADTLVLNFQVPAVAAETSVKLDVEIINQNSLKLVRTLTIKARP